MNRFLSVGRWSGILMAILLPFAVTAQPRIVATTGMIGDSVSAIVGDLATVEVLLATGIDPHTYRLNRQDVVRLTEADIIIYNGGLLEGRMTDTLRQFAERKLVISVGDLLDPALHLASEDYPGEYDPHLWMDVRRWQAALQALEQALSAAYPQYRAQFLVNRTAYDQQLLQLDAYIRQIVATLPPERRVLITAHDAFQYFADAYQFEVHGIQGVSTESEANLQQVNALIDLIVTRQIPAVFAESSVNDRQVRALIEGATARGQPVRLGSELFSDAMGEPGTYEGTYLGMMDHNATAIVRALGGEAPVGGWQGSLTRNETQ